MAGNSGDFTEETIITNFIPTLAKTWQKTITISKTDYENRFKQILRTYEVLLKTIAAVLYGRVCYHHAHVPEIELLLKDKPTLGKFHRFNHACRKVLRTKGDPWTQELEQALSRELTEQAVIHVCHTTRVDLKEESQWNKKVVTVRELFTILVDLRNRAEHDAPPKRIFKELHDDLYLTLVEIFRILRNVLEESWYAVQASRSLPDQKHHYEMHEFCGIHENLKEVTTDRHLIGERLYVYDQRLQPPWIELWPMAHWDNTDNKIYLYNGFLGNENAVFVDYTATKKPLHLQGRTFEVLFNISPETSESFEDEKISAESAEDKRVSESETGDRATAAMILKGKGQSDKQDESLIWVSYARTDDQPPSGETEGWVTTLIKRLKDLLVQKLSREEAYSLTIDYPLNGNTQVTSEIIDTIQQAAFLLVILSRDYLASDWCQRERNNFLRMVEEFVRDGSRVFIIELDRLEDKTLFPEFAEVLDYYDFYTVDSEEGHSRVLMPTIQQDMYRYNNLLTRLSRDLENKFQKQRRRQKHAALADQNMSLISNGGSTVFLAGVTDDLETTREEIKASLAEANIAVIPDICYFNEPEAFEKVVHDNLVRSDLFVQLLGAFPGKRPPGLSQGYVRRQYELAQEVRKRIMQWRSPKLDIENIQDSDWYRFLKLETVRALALEDFVSEIIRTLAPPSSPKKGGTGGTNPPPGIRRCRYRRLRFGV